MAYMLGISLGVVIPSEPCSRLGYCGSLEIVQRRVHGLADRFASTRCGRCGYANGFNKDKALKMRLLILPKEKRTAAKTATRWCWWKRSRKIASLAVVAARVMVRLWPNRPNASCPSEYRPSCNPSCAPSSGCLPPFGLPPLSGRMSSPGRPLPFGLLLSSGRLPSSD